jgi:hypothetical protein
VVKKASGGGFGLVAGRLVPLHGCVEFRDQASFRRVRLTRVAHGDGLGGTRETLGFCLSQRQELLAQDA